MSLRRKMLVSLFAALICVSSIIILPIGPVPVTLQVFFIVLTGAVLGPKMGALSVVIWILLGTFGLPVFAGGKAGPMVILGPTGGYLPGFAICAWIVGVLTKKQTSSRVRIGVAMVIGMTVAYAIGLIGFMASFAFFLQKPMTVQQALAIAVYPFVLFDLAKIVLAAWMTPILWAAIQRAGLTEREVQHEHA
ncbi:MAG TPA: biotin transporter BioY [Negativicutes bacterium]|nr:biotin transporter BioY [Negativicutes bacterium]